MPEPRTSSRYLAAATRAEIVAGLRADEKVGAIARRLEVGREVVLRIRGEVMPEDTTARGVVIHVRVSSEEARAFAALCAQEGVTKSQRIRDLMRGAAGFAMIDARTLREMEAARRELLAIGRNLNQIARAANSGRTILRQAELQRVEAMFREIQGFLIGLNGMIAASRRRSSARMAPEIPEGGGGRS